MAEEIDQELKLRGLAALLRALEHPPLPFAPNEFWWSNLPSHYWQSEFLAHLEHRANELKVQLSNERRELDYPAIQAFLASIILDEFFEVRIDGDDQFELWRFSQVVTEDAYPNLWLAFQLVPGDKGFGLDPENGGFGYHIHYVRLKSKCRRTNVAFTFHPKEPLSSPNKLYWYHHGAGPVPANPSAFGHNRKKNIHAVAETFLTSRPKSAFLSPPSKAQILFP